MEQPFIALQQVCKSYGDHVLFDHFSCEIGAGEFVVITGESGCGKTTLLNLIGGLEPVNSGSIRVAGIDITARRNLQSYYRNIVGFLFQNFALVEQKTVEENLNLVHRKGKSAVTIEQALSCVGMAGTQRQKVYSLSGGEQQRVALARLRLKRCQLVLADEPTGSLDRKNGKLVMDLLRRMKEEGKTVILVTHDESWIQPGDRTIELKKST